MFWIFKIFPDWLWPVLVVVAIIAFFMSNLVPLKQYQLLIKIVSGITIAVTIFICGLQHSDQRWQAAAQELQAKVDIMQAQSMKVNEVIKEKTITKLQIVKVRGDTITEYVTREVAKHDGGCAIPPEFVRAHNNASEVPQ
jgi:hypothetical protein